VDSDDTLLVEVRVARAFSVDILGAAGLVIASLFPLPVVPKSFY
jgi:hypothetical protein